MTIYLVIQTAPFSTVFGYRYLKTVSEKYPVSYRTLCRHNTIKNGHMYRISDDLVVHKLTIDMGNKPKK